MSKEIVPGAESMIHTPKTELITLDPSIIEVQSSIASKVNALIEAQEIPTNVQAFLRDALDTFKHLKGKGLGENPVFSHDLQHLDGFQLGFMEPTLFLELCDRHGLDPSLSEAIMMQADKQADPHVHLQGRGMFFPLGMDQGFPDSAGGTYMGDFVEGAPSAELSFVPAKEGQSFVVPPGKVHFFSPKEGSTFSAIAFVDPKIKQEEGVFDIVRFQDPVISEDGQTAVVRPI